MAQICFDGLVRLRQQLGKGYLVGETAFELSAGEIVCRKTGQNGKACVNRNDHLSVTDQKPLDGGIGEIAHPVDFKFRAAMVADIEHDAGQRQSENGKARDRHAYRKPPGRQRRLRNLHGWVGNDRHRAHRGEVMAADRKRQQQGAADLPFFLSAMQPDRKRDRTDRRTKYDGGGDKDGIPEDHARNLERRHSGIMHRGDAAGDDGAADPWCRGASSE